MTKEEELTKRALKTDLLEVGRAINCFCDDCCYPRYRSEFRKRVCLNLECSLFKYCPYKLGGKDIERYRKGVKNE